MKQLFFAFALFLSSHILVAQAPWKVLHYTETTGYNHGTKSVSLAMFQSWSGSANFVVTNDDSGSEFNSLANLQQYAVVVFSNTSGAGGLNASQRANFEAYIASGGSYLGIHAASDTYRHSSANGSSTGNWDWYAETVSGASVQQSPNHTSSNHNNTMTKQVVGHPSLVNLPNPWNKTEEYYYWENGYLNSSFTELLRVGQTGGNSYDAPRMMAHCKELPGGGRAFYTALGHSSSNYSSDPNFRQLIYDALLWCADPAINASASETIEGALEVWSDITITWDGPQSSETATPNPFLDYRLTVTFTQGGVSYTVPGYFAADGQASESSATSGNKWRAHFRPPAAGVWNYSVSFRQGPGVAIDLDPNAGSAAPSLDGITGSLTVFPSTAQAPDLRAKGMLQYAGHRYLQFAGTGEFFLKAGADAPENFLGYFEFDNTTDHGGSSNDLQSTKSYDINGQTFTTHGDGLHHYDAHVQHWQSGDPTWQGGKGKGIIGAINYLSSTGCNVFSMLTMNVNGDGREVYPHINYNGNSAPQDDRLRFDVSKLAQWEVVFSHAETKGMFLHFKLTETENDDLLDGDFYIGAERKLYFREMVARFGHHLALNWNLGEEFGGSNGSINPFKTAVEQYCQFIRAIDPYDHPIVLHNWAGKENVRFDPHAGNPMALHGLSLQQHHSTVHDKTITYVTMSENAGYPWIVSNDEQGTASVGVEPDFYNNGNNNQGLIRHYVLWGNLMAGGAGVEYYFGYNRPQDDLESETWQARDSMWRYSRLALEFFRTLPFWTMHSDDALSSPGNYVFTDHDSTYALYIPSGGNATLSASAGNYLASWYNPRSGSWIDLGQVTAPGGSHSFGIAPYEASEDWVFLLRKEAQPVFAIQHLEIYPDGTNVCWEASSDLAELTMERAGSEDWEPFHTTTSVLGCIPVVGCQTQTIRAVALATDGETSYSNTIEVQPAGSFEPISASYVLPCSEKTRIPYRIHDLSGRLVLMGHTLSQEGRQIIPLSGLPAGLYALTIEGIHHRQLIQR